MEATHKKSRHEKRNEDVLKVYNHLKNNANYTISDIKSVIQKMFSLSRPQVSGILKDVRKVDGKKSAVYVSSNNPDTYICPLCKNEKPKSEFSKKGKYRDGVTDRVYPYCKSCSSEYQRPITIKRLYNLTEEQYNKLGSVCMICGRAPKENSKQKHIPVDHDHKTGLIRGRICQRCNRGLAWFQDDISLFQSCIDYLSSPPAPKILGYPVYGRTGRLSSKRNKNKLVSKKAIQDIKDATGVTGEW